MRLWICTGSGHLCNGIPKIEYTLQGLKLAGCTLYLFPEQKDVNGQKCEAAEGNDPVQDHRCRDIIKDHAEQALKKATTTNARIPQVFCAQLLSANYPMNDTKRTGREIRATAADVPACCGVTLPESKLCSIGDAILQAENAAILRQRSSPGDPGPRRLKKTSRTGIFCFLWNNRLDDQRCWNA